MEVVVLKRLQKCNSHICEFIGCGRNDKVNYVVMTLLGPNLSDLRKQQPHQRFSISTVLRVGVQIITAVQAMHDCGFLHRDIKPSNFAIGTTPEMSRTCYMLDFGLARQYTTVTGEVRQPRPVAGFRGTVRYASLNAHLARDLGRHDDLWSVFYLLVELSIGQLPWRKTRDKEEAGDQKAKCDHAKLINNKLPSEFNKFLNHLKSSTYFDKPDYSMIIGTLQKAINRLGILESDPYDWEQDYNAPSITSASIVSPPAMKMAHKGKVVETHSPKDGLEPSKTNCSGVEDLNENGEKMGRNIRVKSTPVNYLRPSKSAPFGSSSKLQHLTVKRFKNTKKACEGDSTGSVLKQNGNKQNEEISSGQDKEISSGQSKEIPPGQSKEIPSGQSKEIPSGQSKEIPSGQNKEIPSGQSKEIPSGQSKEIPSGKSKEIPSEKSKEIPSGKSKEIPSEKSKEIPSEKSKEIPSEKSKEIPSRQSKEIPSGDDKLEDKLKVDNKHVSENEETEDKISDSPQNTWLSRLKAKLKLSHNLKTGMDANNYNTEKFLGPGPSKKSPKSTSKRNANNEQGDIKSMSLTSLIEEISNTRSKSPYSSGDILNNAIIYPSELEGEVLMNPFNSTSKESHSTPKLNVHAHSSSFLCIPSPSHHTIFPPLSVPEETNSQEKEKESSHSHLNTDKHKLPNTFITSELVPRKPTDKQVKSKSSPDLQLEAPECELDVDVKSKDYESLEKIMMDKPAETYKGPSTQVRSMPKLFTPSSATKNVILVKESKNKFDTIRNNPSSTQQLETSVNQPDGYKLRINKQDETGDSTANELPILPRPPAHPPPQNYSKTLAVRRQRFISLLNRNKK